MGFDIMPTKENLERTFVDDSIGRDNSVISFVNLLASVDNVSSIALDSPWGSGKTFFVKHIQMILDSLNENNPFSTTETAIKILEKIEKIKNPSLVEHMKPMITAYYDAWEHDDEDDPILSLIYEIMKENYSIANIPNKRDWSNVFSRVVDSFAKTNIYDLVNELRGKDLFFANKEDEDKKESISRFLNSLLPENGNKLIVFIDELDRCSPTYGVKLLERIKHYMQSENIIFVFSINQTELQKTIRKFYGADFDACRYLDRFFDLRVGLPPVDIKRFSVMLGVPEHMNLRQTTCFEFIKLTDMSLREMSKYLCWSKAATYKITDGENAEAYGSFHFESSDAALLAFDVVVPIAIGLRIIDLDAYNTFVTGKDPKWLERVLLTEELINWVYVRLLDDVHHINQEEFDEKTAMKIIDEFYDAVFVKLYDDGREFETKIGRVVVDATIRNSILQAVDMGSKYIDYKEL